MTENWERSSTRSMQPLLSDHLEILSIQLSTVSFKFIEVSFLLEEILRRKVEIVTPEGLSPHIGPHILKEIESVPVAA